MDLHDITSVAVLGTGMMGPGIALSFARKGYRTMLWGRDPEKTDAGMAHLGTRTHGKSGI